MGNTDKAAQGTNGFDLNQEIRLYQADQVRAIRGTKFDSLAVVNDIVGTWKGADPTKTYGGLVPMINGVADYRAAIRIFDLQQDRLAHFPEGAGGHVEWIVPADDLHRIARELRASSPTYDAWLHAIAARFSQGGYFDAVEYTAKTKKNGIWPNAVLGASLQPLS